MVSLGCLMSLIHQVSLIITLSQQDIIYVAVGASPSSVESVVSDLTNLSLTSVTSSESSRSREGSVDHSTSHRTQCKSCAFTCIIIE